jgi:hypothetical protein
MFGLVTVDGFVVWDYTAQNGYSIFLSSFNLGLLMFGIGNVLISSMNYLIDGYRGMANEAVLAYMATKNIFSFGYSSFINDWVARDGLYKVCWIQAAVAVGIWITYPITYFFGKKYRGYWARHNIINKLGITTHEGFRSEISVSGEELRRRRRVNELGLTRTAHRRCQQLSRRKVIRNTR